jgi:mRNA interferase RelE/StbE
MAYAVELKPAAVRSLKKLAKGLQKRIAARIDRLADNPRPPGVEKLSGEQDYYRVRVGDYRIVYEVKEHILLVLVLRIGHRREIYQRFFK